MRVPGEHDLLTGSSNEVWGGRERGHSGDICARALVVQHKVHAGLFDLIVHHTGEVEWPAPLHILVPLCV